MLIYNYYVFKNSALYSNFIIIRVIVKIYSFITFRV